MDKRKTLLLLLAFGGSLSSCFALPMGPGTTDVTNRYPDFASMKKAFDRGVSKNKKNEKCIATVFDVSKIEGYRWSGSRFYISGLCADRKKQTDFDDICENIIPYHGEIYLWNEEFDVYVSFEMNEDIETYSSISFQEFQHMYDKGFNVFSSVSSAITSDWEANEKDGQYPPELSKFRYEKSEVEETILSDRFRLLSCEKEEISFATILFSKRTSIENVDAYSKAVQHFLQECVSLTEL